MNLRAFFDADARIALKFPYSESLKNEIKTFGGEWDKRKRYWSFYPNLNSIDFVLKKGFQFSKSDESILSEIVDALLEDEQQQEYRYQLATSIHAPGFPDVAAKCLFPPRSYQWVPTHYALSTGGRFILADAPGVGKTFEGVLVTMHPKFEDEPVLIVCPANVIYQFQAELLKLFGQHSIILENKLHYLVPNVRYYLCTYEQMKKQDDLGYFFIFDEAHRLKDTKTVRYKEAQRLTAKCKHILLMTGTPVLNRSKEAFALLNLVSPGFMSFAQFTKEFCGAYHDGYSYNTNGNSNTNRLHRYMYSNHMMRREPEQVESQLPPQTHQVVELAKKVVTSDSVFGLYSDSGLLKSQDPTFLEWMDDAFEVTDKFLLFAYHKPMMDAMEKKAQELGYSYIRIDGDTPADQRHKLAERFNNDPSIKVAILSITAASEGLNLQAANVVIFAELYFVPGIIEQCYKRSHRSGQERHVLILYPLWSEFEHYLQSLLMEKMAFITRLHKGLADEVKQSSLVSDIAKKFNIPSKSKKNDHEKAA